MTRRPALGTKQVTTADHVLGRHENAQRDSVNSMRRRSGAKRHSEIAKTSRLPVLQWTTYTSLGQTLTQTNYKKWTLFVSQKHHECIEMATNESDAFENVNESGMRC